MRFLLTFMFMASAATAAAEAQDTCVHISEIQVTALTGAARIQETPTPITVISADALLTTQSTNIIDAISRQPGVSQITTGGAISKPVIRGLGYNRVLVVDDGLRQEGQQWGDEHGIEVDAQSVSSVEIQKGPATLLYGSDAMAGVILLHHAPTLPRGEHRANVTSEYQTNQGLFAYSLNLEGNPGLMTYNVRYSDKMAHDYKNATDGYVAGSRFRERALSGTLGVNRQWGYSRLKLSYYHLTPGIIEGERDEVTGELLCSDNGKHYGAELPYQQIHHYKAALDNSLHLGGGQLKATVGYQQNRRQEFEESASQPGLDFLLHTVSYNLRWAAPEWQGWNTNVGLSGMWQQSRNKGDEYLIPAYHLLDVGAYATASRSLTDRLHIQGGLRYDHRHLNSHALIDDGEERFRQFSRSFQALTGSLGAVWNITSRWDLRLNVSRGYRAPNLSELGSNGEHEGTLRYEVGDDNLRAEYSWQGDIGMDYSSEYFSLQLALFANHIDNFIYLRRMDGQEEEGLPVYGYTQGDARLVGGELRIIIHPLRHLHWENSLSYVHATLLHSDADSRHLPYTPAPRWLSQLHYDLPINCRALANSFVSVEVDCNLRQNNIYRAADTETATPSYTLLNLAAGTDVMRHGRKLLTLSLTATNLLNRTYQSHLSRLKYADTNVVTGRTGVSNMGRNVGIKVSVPIIL